MASYLTDFSEYSSGSQPSDWTKRWNDSWTTLEVNTGSYSSELYGDLCLVVDPSATNIKIISWDDIDSDADRDDAEVLIRVRGKDNGGNYRLVNVFSRASGSTGSEEGYFAEVSYDDLIIGKYVAGTRTVLDTHNNAIDYYGDWDGYWFWLRFRVNGTSVQAKIWKETAQEPDAWGAEATDSSVTAAGWVGVGFYQDLAGADVDIVSIATNGDTASFPSSDASSQINLSQMFVDVAEADGAGVINLSQMFLDVAEEYGINTVQYGFASMEVIRVNPASYAVQVGQMAIEVIREYTPPDLLVGAVQLEVVYENPVGHLLIGAVQLEVLVDNNSQPAGGYTVVCVNS